MDDHNAPMTKFFLMYRLGLHKGLLEECAEFCRLIESDHAIN